MNEQQSNLVSTIIPVFNRPAMLRSAVQSVIAQTHRPIEIVIVDDGSTDETADVGRELQSRYPGEVVYLWHENAGPGPSRELGRQRATGEFIQYLDSDDRLLPNKFADQVAALRRCPQCDIAYGTTRLVNASGEVLKDPFKWTAEDIPELFPGLLVDRWWCTHTPLYRRSLTDRIGPWCDMRWSQDWEYDSRIGALNVKLVHCGSHVSEHVHHEGERQTDQADWESDPVRLRNRVRLMEVLWEGSSTAGVPSSAPERQHFARWCFYIARNCVAARLDDEASRCLKIAEEAAGRSGTGRKGLATYRFLLRTIGYQMTAEVTSLAARLRSRPGHATMEQSFAAK